MGPAGVATPQGPGLPILLSKMPGEFLDSGECQGPLPFPHPTPGRAQDIIPKSETQPRAC